MVSSIAITISVLSPLKLNSSKFSLAVRFPALQDEPLPKAGVPMSETMLSRDVDLISHVDTTENE